MSHTAFFDPADRVLFAEISWTTSDMDFRSCLPTLFLRDSRTGKHRASSASIFSIDVSNSFNKSFIFEERVRRLLSRAGALAVNKYDFRISRTL